MMLGHCGQRSHGTRKGESSPPPMRQVDTDRTRVLSQRQLPTDHDYAGGQRCSIREYQGDQPSLNANSTFARNAPPRRERK